MESACFWGGLNTGSDFLSFGVFGRSDEVVVLGLVLNFGIHSHGHDLALSGDDSGYSERKQAFNGVIKT